MNNAPHPATAAAGKHAAIILAAGKSTRMKSELPKPLHTVCGLPMSRHVIDACRGAGIERVVVVVGHHSEQVRQALGDDVEYAVQQLQRGTGDAVKAASGALNGWPGGIIVLAGDAPLIQASTLARVMRLREESGSRLAMLTAKMADATGYGRVVRDPDGRVLRIVEERDATPEQRAITEWNPSVYAFEAEALWRSLALLEPTNAQGEFYLTDTVRIIADTGEQVVAEPVDDAGELLGINNRAELAEANSIMQRRINRRHMLSGVSIIDPDHTYIDADVTIGQDTTIMPGTSILQGASVGSKCTIGPNAVIRRSRIEDECHIVSSQVVEAEIKEGVRVGPFANLRPGTKLNRGVRIGDFVEIKNAMLGEGVQVNHLSYIGDAVIGAFTNIGAGTVTCNFDGYRKHTTTIGARAFIGSHSTLVAPIQIGDGAIVAAGSTIPSSDVPGDALAIARSMVTLKAGWAAKYRDARGKREG